MNTKSFLRKYLKPVGFRQLLVFLIITLYVANNLFGPLMISFLIDNVINDKPITMPLFARLAELLGGTAYLRQHLWLGAAVLLVTSTLLCLCIFFRGRLNSQIAENISENLRNDLYDHLQLLPYSYQTRANSGDLIQRCTSDVDNIRRFFGGRLGEMFYAIAMSLIAGVVLFSINPSLAVYGVSFIPVIFIISVLFFRRVQHFFTDYDEKEAVLTTVTQENLGNLRAVRAFNREQYEVDKFDKANHDLSLIDFRWIEELGRQWSLGDFLTLIPILVVIILGIFQVTDGRLTIGQFSVFITYEGMILNPIRQLARIISEMGKMKVSIDRICEIFNEPIEDVESGCQFDPQGDIVFKDVCFQYADGNIPVLKNISFTIPKGQTLAIMGPTGSGKSTMVHLLTRLHDYTSGSITIGGVELKDIQKKSLRKNIGIVLQEPFLFSRTIYDNIRISRQSASKEQIQRAARIASVHQVIEDFSKGYDTLVGEKGVTLSGGQKQRIAIARTIINNCPILIFDDSLSAVDTQTDSSIRRAIRELSRDCTTIIIAHRISSLQDADNIIVLEDGEIAEMGNHQQLLANNGLYRRIYDIQTAISEEV